MKTKTFLQLISGGALIGSLFLSVITPVEAQSPVATTAAEATTTDVSATSTSVSTALPNNDQSLCLPYLDGAAAANCLMAGPAQQLASLASKGITFPSTPLNLVHPPADLATIPFTYAKVTDVDDPIPLYASVDDAIAKNPKEVWPASKFKYVALSQKVTATDGTIYYQIANQDWISGTLISKVAQASFQGYLIKQPSVIPFGWILQSEIPSYVSPSYGAAKSGRVYNRLDIVQCYDSQTVGGIEWVMIGPNEWMDHKYIGRVINNPTPPAGVTNGRWIEVNLYEQVMTVYENNKMIFATLVGSGEAPFYTQPGTFKIYRKVENEYMTGSFESDHSDFYYIEQVPFIMYYDGARALHGAYWNNYLGYQGSHGCVNLSVADSHWLYNWANEGDTVYVWDPSGKTPKDTSNSSAAF